MSNEIWLFGYFCQEQDGIEDLLVRYNDAEWDFPIVSSHQVVSDVQAAVDSQVIEFCKRNKIINTSDLLAEGLPEYNIAKVLVGPMLGFDSQITEESIGYFYKVKLTKDYQARDPFRWFSKREIFEQASKCKNKHLLDAIRRNHVYHRADRKILECVDVLVFKRTENYVEFLLLKREDPLSGFVGWEYPKGGILFHETIKEGALHRLREETGSEDYRFCAYLGHQIVDVSERKLHEYDTLKVHGLTFEFVGDERQIQPHDTREHLRNPVWMSWENAKGMLWMKTYGPVFFERWAKQKDTILASSSENNNGAF